MSLRKNGANLLHGDTLEWFKTLAHLAVSEISTDILLAIR
jgi:hypothetical protein